MKIHLKNYDQHTYLTLHSELNIFISWVERFGLLHNLDKMPYHDFSIKHTPISHSYYLNSILLRQVFLYNDFRIQLFPSLIFDHHIIDTVDEAQKYWIS